MIGNNNSKLPKYTITKNDQNTIPMSTVSRPDMELVFLSMSQEIEELKTKLRSANILNEIKTQAIDKLLLELEELKKQISSYKTTNNSPEPKAI